jgi:hypothetical protein
MAFDRVAMQYTTRLPLPRTRLVVLDPPSARTTLCTRQDGPPAYAAPKTTEAACLCQC